MVALVILLLSYPMFRVAEGAMTDSEHACL